jgi:hypothetical protein
MRIPTPTTPMNVASSLGLRTRRKIIISGIECASTHVKYTGTGPISAHEKMEVKRDRILLVLGMRNGQREWSSQWSRTRSVHCPDASKTTNEEGRLRTLSESSSCFCSTRSLRGKTSPLCENWAGLCPFSRSFSQ